MTVPDEHALVHLVRGGYDLLVDRYVAEFFHELDRKPFDRTLLDELAERIGTGGRACDIGCGPGHIGAYLADRGLSMSGVDASTNMVHRARALNQGIDFSVGDMRALAMADASLDGIVAFYSIIHLLRRDAPVAIAEFARVLRPGGHMLLSFHAGTGDVHVDEMLGEPVPMYATFYTLDEMCAYVRDAQLDVVEALSRPPYDFEYPSERAYITARRRS